MPNLDLKNNKFKVDDSVKSYFGNNSSVSYEYLNKIKSELDNKQKRGPNDDKALQWIEKTLKTKIDAVEAPKRIIMQTDGQGSKAGGNAFKDTHKKDNANADPTRVRIPKIAKGSVARQIMTNKVQYESIQDELSEIRYLIEYMDNKK
jgi:hypothetical protein